jgi:hypothetical protein
MVKTGFSSSFNTLVFIAVLFLSSSALAETMTFKVDLSGNNEVPPIADPGKGTLSATYDSNSKVLTYSVEYSDLSGPVTAAHFHGPSDATNNAPVLIPVTGSLTSPMKGSATLTDPQAADLIAGRLYFNIHTAKNRPGEIRGQVTKGK